MTIVRFHCAACGLTWDRFLGPSCFPVHCLACGAGPELVQSRRLEFRQLDEAERLYQMRLAADPGWRERSA